MSDDSDKGYSGTSKYIKEFHSLIAGSAAGLVCTLICSPLDVAKIRLQIQGSLGCSKKYTGSLIHMGRQIHLEEGFKGFYKGLGPALVTVPLFWGIYWGIYDRAKDFVCRSKFISSDPIQHVLAAVFAGGVSNIVTNPLWVVRTRFQALALHPNYIEKENTLSMLINIYRVEGFRALYKGLAASALGLIHVAIQFPLCMYWTLAIICSCSKHMDFEIIIFMLCNIDEYFKKLARERRQDKENVSLLFVVICFYFDIIIIFFRLWISLLLLPLRNLLRLALPILTKFFVPDYKIREQDLIASLV